mmetsp:Transcript_25065/g.52433  ORF Transcript_25065/g.52433 Transcript_25065/m.52433 type:complete len:80 (-) Transcript_25065:28-267(-)
MLLLASAAWFPLLRKLSLFLSPQVARSGPLRVKAPQLPQLLNSGRCLLLTKKNKIKWIGPSVMDTVTCVRTHLHRFLLT